MTANPRYAQDERCMYSVQARARVLPSEVLPPTGSAFQQGIEGCWDNSGLSLGALGGQGRAFDPGKAAWTGKQMRGC